MESEHIMYLQVITGGLKFYIINVYCQYSKDIGPILRRMEMILEYIKTKDFVITIDTNAKSRCWFLDKCDERGKDVLKSS